MLFVSFVFLRPFVVSVLAFLGLFGDEDAQSAGAHKEAFARARRERLEAVARHFHLQQRAVLGFQLQPHDRAGGIGRRQRCPQAAAAFVHPRNFELVRARVAGSRAGIGCPVLGVWSDRDPALTERQMTDSQRFVTGPWRYERLPRVGHWIPAHAPERTTALLLEHFA